MQAINTQTVPAPIVDSGYGKTFKEFAKKAARYNIEVTAKNMALSYLWGSLWDRDAKNLALMTGIFYAAILPLSQAALKPLVKREDLPLASDLSSITISVLAFEKMGLATSAWSAAVDPWVTPRLPIAMLNLFNVLPNVFSNVANHLDPKPAQDVSKIEPENEVVVPENNAVSAEGDNVISK